jgi:hypothetical protein
VANHSAILSYNNVSTGTSSTYIDTEDDLSAGIFKPVQSLPSHIGIDKLHILIPLSSADTDGSSEDWKKKSYTSTENGQQISKLSGNVIIAPRLNIHIDVFNLGATAEIQFNPSRVVDVQGSSLCPIEMVEASVLWVLKQLEDLITPIWAVDQSTGVIGGQWPSNWYSMIDCKRVDIAIDFTIATPGFDVDTLRTAVSARHNRLSVDENRGRINSLTWGSSTWLREVLYSKERHPDHVNSSDQFRYEIQLNRKYTRVHGWNNLLNVTAVNVLNLLDARWKKSGLNEKFVMKPSIKGFYRNALTLMSPTKASTLLGAAFLENKGVDCKLNPRTFAEYRKIAAQLGYTLGDDLCNLGEEFFELNYLSGTLDQVQ